MNTFLSSWSPRILSVLRIIAGFLIFFSRQSKNFFNYPSKEGFTAATGLMLVAGILEFFGGILLFSRFIYAHYGFLLCAV